MRWRRTELAICRTLFKKFYMMHLWLKVNLLQMVNLRYKKLKRGRNTKQMNGNKFKILVIIINVNEPNVLVKRQRM